MDAITPRLVELKAKIFCSGVRIDEALWRELADEHHYRHKRAGVSQGRFLELRDGLAVTVVNAPVREPFVARSSLRLEREDGGFALFEREVRLAACRPVPWPRWYSLRTRDGTPMPLVVSAHSTTSLYTAIYQGGCDFFADGQECQFCAMKIDNTLEWRRIEQIIEVAEAALAENPRAELSFGGGTRRTADRSARFDAEAVRALRRAVDMPVCVEMAPPDTDDWIDRLVDAGTTSLMFNLELWDPEHRARFMPGKSAISRERYLEALRYGVRRLGADQVSSQVLVGLEPVEHTLAAVRAIADMGAIPLPIVFRPLANTRLVDHPTPPIDEVVRVFGETLEVMRARGLGPSRAGCALCGACSAHR